MQIVRAPGFLEPIELSLRPQNGFTASFNPNPVAGDESIMQLTADENVPTGYHKLFLIGQSEGFADTTDFTAYVSPAHIYGFLHE